MPGQAAANNTVHNFKMCRPKIRKKENKGHVWSYASCEVGTFAECLVHTTQFVIFPETHAALVQSF